MAFRLQAVLKNNGKIDALLYGHNHLGKKRNGVLGIPRCYDAGSSTRKDSSVGEHRVIDLSRDPRMLRCGFSLQLLNSFSYENNLATEATESTEKKKDKKNLATNEHE